MGLFDPAWYMSEYKLPFDNDFEAFMDYVRKSPYVNVSPCPEFDSATYLIQNNDVYQNAQSPLVHYLTHGYAEGRPVTSTVKNWTPRTKIVAATHNQPYGGSYAVVLHIYYKNFVSKFNEALSGVGFDFDLFVTATDAETVQEAKDLFSKNKRINNISVKQVPNRGRNFGPFLVEFREELLRYDYFLHLHSKKSLYSGKEQQQWADYLIEYLAKDKHILAQALNILRQEPSLGLFYPVSFWNLPPWVNHWLQNKGLGRHILEKKYDIIQHEDFFAYPVGGMFWAKPSALKDILLQTWSYEDFAEEPLPADGSELHVLERILPFIAKKNGFSQFFYNPGSGDFTTDDSFIFKSYNNNENHLKQSVLTKQIISFDVFDTVVKRDYLEPDYAKYQMASKLGLDIDPTAFVRARNEAELNIRRRRNFDGDVTIYEIYDELGSLIPNDLTTAQLAEMEFSMDLAGLSAKSSMVNIVNECAQSGKVIYFITDTYYAESQIRRLLTKAGIACAYELYVSSELKMRKDSGTMWHYIKDKLVADGMFNKHIHVGDSVTSDAQNPGDLGILSFHILAPMDKWDALGFPYIRPSFNLDNIKSIVKWGPVVSEVGSNPFI